MIWRSKLHLSFYSFFYGMGINFFHKVAIQDENLQYGCTFIKFTLDKNHKYFTTSISKKHELDINAEDTNNKQLVELRYRWADVLCYFTELETGPEANLELQHFNFSLDIKVSSVTCSNYRVSTALHTWKYSMSWGPEETLRNISSSKHALKY